MFSDIAWKKTYPHIPQTAQYWLFDDNSLTTKLQKLYPNFQVKVIAETIQDSYLQREVRLCDGDIPLVHAISLIPTDCGSLQNLGNTPLGEILFQKGQRLEIAITNKNGNWGRKSLFEFENYQIIVCEFFLPALYT
jgi:chorismate--pyruvate lyase